MSIPAYNNYKMQQHPARDVRKKPLNPATAAACTTASQQQVFLVDFLYVFSYFIFSLWPSVPRYEYGYPLLYTPYIVLLLCYTTTKPNRIRFSCVSFAQHRSFSFVVIILHVYYSTNAAWCHRVLPGRRWHERNNDNYL